MMPEPPANSVEGAPSTVWPGVLFSLLFYVELRALLPHCPLLSSFSWGAAPAPRGKKGIGPSCLLILFTAALKTRPVLAFAIGNYMSH